MSALEDLIDLHDEECTLIRAGETCTLGLEARAELASIRARMEQAERERDAAVADATRIGLDNAILRSERYEARAQLAQARNTIEAARKFLGYDAQEYGLTCDHGTGLCVCALRAAIDMCDEWLAGHPETLAPRRCGTCNPLKPEAAADTAKHARAVLEEIERIYVSKANMTPEEEHLALLQCYTIAARELNLQDEYAENSLEYDSEAAHE